MNSDEVKVTEIFTDFIIVQAQTGWGLPDSLFIDWLINAQKGG
jgi:hypothetical protein